MANKTTILIVEDNELNMEMVKDLLEEVGFDTLEAEDAVTGIQLAKKHHPDLILMDMHMPIKNGYEASKVLKADAETCDIPIVAFTALAMAADQKKAMANGCSGLISKPIDIDHFAETVAAYLQNKPDYPISGSAELKVEIVSAERGRISKDELQELLMRLSHDLQAPIRKAKQFSRMLGKSAQERLNPEECDLLDRIEKSTQQMQDVLSNTLAVLRESRE